MDSAKFEVAPLVVAYVALFAQAVLLTYLASRREERINVTVLAFHEAVSSDEEEEEHGEAGESDED